MASTHRRARTSTRHLASRGALAILQPPGPDDAADVLHLHEVHKVAAAVCTRSGAIFAGITTETRRPFADVCGEGHACLGGGGQLPRSRRDRCGPGKRPRAPRDRATVWAMSRVDRRLQPEHVSDRGYPGAAMEGPRRHAAAAERLAARNSEAAPLAADEWHAAVRADDIVHTDRPSALRTDGLVASSHRQLGRCRIFRGIVRPVAGIVFR